MYTLRNALGAALLLAILTAAGPALAEPITGTPDNDVLPGTAKRDTIHGLAGDDDITGRKGNDRVFGDEGFDTFHWAEGDGQDRVDGGLDFDRLQITAGGRLRLHIDALDAGPLATVQDGLEAIGVRAIEQIVISGTGSADKFVISSDEDISGPISIFANGGRDLVDARKTKVNLGAGFTGGGIGGGDGDDVVWVGRAGALVDGGSGDDEIHLNKGADNVNISVFFGAGHDVIFNFGESDFMLFRGLNSDDPANFDTNGNGFLDAGDTPVKIKNGNMTIDASEDGTTSIVTIVGSVRLPLDQFGFSNNE